MDEQTAATLAPEIDHLLTETELTIPGIAGRLRGLGVRTEDPSELIALINRPKYGQ